jgi:nitrite reductase/ring-hydroxylating ferredoxin subunit
MFTAHTHVCSFPSGTISLYRSLSFLRLTHKFHSSILSLNNRPILITEREEAAMEKIANLKDIKKGGSTSFTYKGEKAILIRTKQDDIFAYVAVCPHEGGDIQWDEQLEMVLCETHLSLFNVADGSIYRHSSDFEVDKGLTKIDLSVDEEKNIFAL